MRAVLLVLALAAGLYALPAEAARCPSGQVYRPSVGVCQSKAAAARQGVYKPRVARASIRHRLKRAPAPRPRVTRVLRARAQPAMPATPMWYVLEPNPFREPYGRLVLPLANYDPVLASWASLRLWSREP
jgi:hypothetical protein